MKRLYHCPSKQILKINNRNAYKNAKDGSNREIKLPIDKRLRFDQEHLSNKELAFK